MSSLRTVLLILVSLVVIAPTARASLSLIINNGLACKSEKDILQALNDTERADICTEACKKMDDLIDPSKTDKKAQECREAAETIEWLFSYLQPLGANNGTTPIETEVQSRLKKLMDKKGCFLDLQTKWMWRDFICASNEESEAGALEQKQSAARRFALEFISFYHETDKENKVFCYPTMLRILSDTATNLFERSACGKTHPLWTKFEDNACNEACAASVLAALAAATRSAEGVEGGNAECCAALYYDRAFEFMFANGQELELHRTWEDDVGAGCDRSKLPCTKLEPAVERCVGAEAFKPFRMNKCHSAIH